MSAKTYRVLVVEDHADAAESMRILLNLLGHPVEVAHSGPAALMAARRFRPEVVLCDLGLPGSMDGYDVARALRQDADSASAYLVALTGYDGVEDLRRCREAGFDLHRVKPVDFDDLRGVFAALPR